MQMKRQTARPEHIDYTVEVLCDFHDKARLHSVHK